ncbi:hypothetical protein BDV19DRAFT_380867 [Aspergillus venezuelensis]
MSVQKASRNRRTTKRKGHEFRFVSHRTDTVRILAELVDRENVVHVRGTPVSGKTTLARLLQQYYNDQKRTIYFISNWKKLEDYPTEGEDEPWEKLSQIIHSRYKFTGRTRNLPSGTIIIIDKAQKTYSDTEFWNLVIKERIYGKGDDIKFCLSCSYGSPSTGVDGQTDMFTPAIFKPSQRFKDAVKQICADTKFEVGFTLDNDAEDYLFSLTNGHPGGVESLLNYFYHNYRDRIKHGKLSPITKVNLVDSLQDDGKVWRYLETTPVYRSFPTGPLLSVQAAKVLRHVLEQGSIPVGKQEDITVAVDGDTGLEEAKDRCYTKGRFHKTLVLEDKAGKEEYVLPSRLHEKWVEWILGKQNIRLNSKYDSLRHLCVDILKEFSAATLRHTAAGKILTSAAQYKPLEAAYQDEYYRCFNLIAGRGVSICSEWSRTRDEEDRVHEHLSRFQKGGRYHSWITDGIISDWIIINCANSLPTRCYSEPNLMHAVFSRNWEDLQIIDNKKSSIIDKFPLKK